MRIGLILFGPTNLGLWRTVKKAEGYFKFGPLSNFDNHGGLVDKAFLK